MSKKSLLLLRMLRRKARLDLMEMSLLVRVVHQAAVVAGAAPGGKGGGGGGS
jgi:hypothetical protein